MSKGPEGKPIRKLRCAVYTRKSTEEGLDKEFNSLHAQREACEAYIASQRSEGWALVRDPYDDGGFSGGTLERPALKRLLADIEEGLVDVVVVYKIDRLSRSLMDFSKLVEVFDRSGVTFVSVTQSFNTTTSMGRLTLNILLSFAQFEREVIAERVRDKIRASRQKGMWMGGNVPFGYVVENRRLVVHEPDAATVRGIFERFVRIGSATVLARELRAEGSLTGRGKPFTKGALYNVLNNRTYLGLAVHKGTAYPGEHAAIIDQELWDKVHAILAENARTRSARTRAQTPALLKGLLFGPTGAAMSPTHTRKGNRLYRYYVSQDVLKRGPDACPVGRVPAAEIETAVIDQLRGIFRQPEIIVGTWRAARAEHDDITEDDARGGADATRPAVGRAVPGRAGPDRAAAGRAGRRAHGRRRGPAAAERAVRAGARDGRQQEGGGMTTRVPVSEDGSITIRIPMTFRKRGGRKVIVTPDGAPWAPRPRVDNAMVKALARAFRWRRMLDDGVCVTMEELAESERVNRGYMSRVLRLTLLAPEIVEAILDGRQPDGMRLEDLLEGFPVDWGSQRVDPEL